MECRGRKNQEIKGTSPDPLPPSGSQKGGGAGYARLAYCDQRRKGRSFADTMGICLVQTMVCSSIEAISMRFVVREKLEIIAIFSSLRGRGRHAHNLDNVPLSAMCSGS